MLQLLGSASVFSWFEPLRNFDRHLKAAGGYSGKNVVRIPNKMKILIWSNRYLRWFCIQIQMSKYIIDEEEEKKNRKKNKKERKVKFIRCMQMFAENLKLNKQLKPDFLFLETFVHNQYLIHLNELIFLSVVIYVLCPFRTLVIMALHNFPFFVASSNVCSLPSFLVPVMSSIHTNSLGKLLSVTPSTQIDPTSWMLFIKFNWEQKWMKVISEKVLVLINSTKGCVLLISLK